KLRGSILDVRRSRSQLNQKPGKIEPLLQIVSSLAIRIIHVYKEVVMQKKLTITVNEKVYAGLHDIIGRRNISQFIESLVRPHVLDKDLEEAYCQMAQDEEREAEALEWIEGTLGEITDETRGSVVGKLRAGSRRRNSKAKAGRNHQQ